MSCPFCKLWTPIGRECASCTSELPDHAEIDGIRTPDLQDAAEIGGALFLGGGIVYTLACFMLELAILI